MQQPTTPKPSLGAANAAPANESFVSQYMKRLRSGDLGSLPVILGLVVIAIIFQSLNENFLTARNFVNLIAQTAGIATIAIGMVYVLLLGEIDLSVGYVSGVAAAVLALLLREPAGYAWPVALLIALLAAAAIGLLQGVIITSFQVPSFVVTLSGLLAWNGVVLILMRGAGNVSISNPVIIGIANTYLPPLWGWLVAIVVIAVYAVTQFLAARTRSQGNLAGTSTALIGLQVVAAAVVGLGAVYACNLDRGVPVVGIIVLVLLAIFGFIATRTRFGRYVYAIGGNKEAARRAGIKVEQIRVIVFMIASVMAGCGGIILASRLRSVDTAAGGGNLLLYSIASAVIGGTSLFGGRGRVNSALIGALIIATIDNGMGLLGLSAGVKFVITGLVLLLAVLVDAVSRRGRAGSGRA